MGVAARWLTIAALSTAALTVFPHVAEAKADLTIAELRLPDDQPSKELERAVRAAIAHAAKSADFGSAKHIEITVHLSELSVEETDGIVRVTCTLQGRLKGGGAARSHIAFGDQPSKKKKLEKQVLKMAAESVVARLADLVKDRQAADKKKQGGSKTDKDQDKKKRDKKSS